MKIVACNIRHNGMIRLLVRMSERAIDNATAKFSRLNGGNCFRASARYQSRKVAVNKRDGTKEREREKKGGRKGKRIKLHVVFVPTMFDRTFIFAVIEFTYLLL